MKKIVAVGLKIAIFTFFFQRCSNTQTPDTFRYNNTFSKEEYMVDSTFFVEEVERMIESESGPYYPKEFDSETKIFVDTILYSPNKQRSVIFIITKNSNEKLLVTDSPNDFHYDAHCFLGIKDNEWSINWFRILNLNNFKSYENTSKSIRHKYFVELATLKDSSARSRFKYNVGDTRFWEGPSWDILEGLMEEKYESEN